ncbi:MAG: DUF2283 domain-containing protein [Microcystaceae cyanobacterium]
MKIEFDPMANAVYIRRFTGKVVGSEEVEPGIIYDYDANDTVIGIEILGIKQRTLEQIKSVNFPFQESERQELRQWFNSLAIAC